MSLIFQRPANWNQVIGQERPLKNIHGLLHTPKYQPRGYIFEGPYAVGKTSVAYLFAKALMCLGEDPLGCGKCFACRTPISEMGAFIEVDAASCSGVAQARELMSNVESPCSAAKRYVVLIDEAHQLSSEAWDVFLKPLDSADLGAVFIFVTSQGNKIPNTISSRCATIRFGDISLEAITGYLISLADREEITYTADGIRALAKHANGRLRDAAKNLGLVACQGKVTPETVEDVLSYNSTLLIQELYRNLISSNLKEALAKAEELKNLVGPSRVVQALFAAYSKDIYNEGAISGHFNHILNMTSFFIKWSALPNLTADELPVFILELYELRSDLQKIANNPNAPSPAARVSQYLKGKEPNYMTVEQLKALIKLK